MSTLVQVPAYAVAGFTPMVAGALYDWAKSWTVVLWGIVILLAIMLVMAQVAAKNYLPFVKPDQNREDDRKRKRSAARSVNYGHGGKLSNHSPGRRRRMLEKSRRVIKTIGTSPIKLGGQLAKAGKKTALGLRQAYRYGRKIRQIIRSDHVRVFPPSSNKSKDSELLPKKNRSLKSSKPKKRVRESATATINENATEHYAAGATERTDDS
jgi:hypothetical protein